MKELFTNAWAWLSSKGELNRDYKDSAEKLQLSIRVTAKCRFNASIRLQSQGKFAFFTTTVLSLGLIFIPLMQNAGVELAFNSKILNMMSIFLAVAVLVYSVIIGTARYDVRSEKLNQCGNQLKALNRELDNAIASGVVDIDNNIIDSFQKRYQDIITETENHEEIDYFAAILDMKRDYRISGIPRLYKYLKLKVLYYIPYISPLTMLVIEGIFITDMFKVTDYLVKYLK